ncbi:hypothetical protein [Pedobacter panaciterrae]
MKARTSAFYLDKASQITLRNCAVTWGKNRPDYFAHVLESNGVRDLKTINLEGESAFPAKFEAIKKQ